MTLRVGHFGASASQEVRFVNCSQRFFNKRCWLNHALLSEIWARNWVIWFLLNLGSPRFMKQNQLRFLPPDALQCTAVLRSYVIRPSVRLSETFSYGWNIRIYGDQIGSNSSKIISRPNSLRPLLGLSPTWAIWCNGNTPKIWGGIEVGSLGSAKPCEISETVQDRNKVTITD